jgi:2-oxoglutarate dehydrogenase E2 component (dihydrolipoamide succinyltransferase)
MMERQPMTTADTTTDAAPSTTMLGSPSPLRGTDARVTRLRKLIAGRMLESLQTSAQLTTVVEVDLGTVAAVRVESRESFQQAHGLKLTYLPFLAKATIHALQVHPVVNATMDAEATKITYPAGEHLAVAVDTERGLMAPVVRDAGSLGLAELATSVADLAERCRTAKIHPDELSGGTFTLSNTGSRGALFDTPIINQPQSAILGTGAVVERPVALRRPEGGHDIVVRPMIYLALSYDHRLVDGADAARFLGTMKSWLESPEAVREAVR